MKKIILVLFYVVLCSFAGFSQKVIALHHNNQISFYSSFDSLKVHIQSGDTIYLPGGGITIGGWQIDKKVCIIGAGHYPDSTVATGSTYLYGDIVLKSGADNSFLQGFFLSGNIFFGTEAGNQVVNNINISRSSINNIYLSFNGSERTSSTNIIIKENIIRGDNIAGGYAKSVLIANNFIQGVVSYLDNMMFTNNIHMRGFCGGGPFNNIENSTIQNNIFCFAFYNCSGNYLINNSNGNSFANNIFNIGNSFPNGSNTGIGNWFEINVSSVLVNQSEYTFNYSHNYHLKNPSQYLGTDGTQVGLYGSYSPYKEGVVPYNPHIQSKNINPATDNSGNLNINIKVKAQNN
jgi:hypothetical protein